MTPPSVLSFTGISPRRVLAASSGDFGYTYVSVTCGAAGGKASEYYLRIWRRRPSGIWYLVLDLANGPRR